MKRQGGEELGHMVETGEVGLEDAHKAAKAEPEIRDEAIKRVKRGEDKKLQTAIQKVKQGRKERKAMSETPSTIYRLHHSPVAYLWQKVEPESIDVIFADPPYGFGAIDTYSDLVAFANHALKRNGHLLAMTGYYHLPHVLDRMLDKGLSYNWLLTYHMPGSANNQRQRGVFTTCKGIIWMTKGTYTGDGVHDYVNDCTGNRDNRMHQWGQGVAGITEALRRFVKPGDVVCDPFVGGGATGVAARLLGCEFVGADIDKECLETTEKRLAVAQEKGSGE